MLLLSILSSFKVDCITYGDWKTRLFRNFRKLEIESPGVNVDGWVRTLNPRAGVMRDPIKFLIYRYTPSALELLRECPRWRMTEDDRELERILLGILRPLK